MWERREERERETKWVIQKIKRRPVENRSTEQLKRVT